MRRLFYKIFGFLVFGFASLSHAHQLSTSYLSGRFDDVGVFQGDWQVRLYDLEQAIGVDVDGDGNLRWQELQSRSDIVNQYLKANLHFLRATKNCTFAIESDWKVDTHFNEGYLVLPVRVQCPLNGDVDIYYSAFFNEDSQHKLLVSLSDEKNATPRILSDSVRRITFTQGAGNRLATFNEFIAQGAVHIWKGFDHILFLLSLLLTCVLVRNKQQWIANNNVREIITHTTWIVTAFTLAHSITLTATALQWIHLPSRWVEVGIAITVVLAALNNIFPVVLRLGWLTFGFGLLHGMGFAGALGELGLPADQQTLTVLAFNIGVEIGQMAIVLAALPLLMFVRHYFWYARYSMTGLSAVIALIATQWVIQRI